ncbi:MAG: exodeoxyribonuclease VII large subunit [Clostridia bacterium]|nr:exodeoxyribonuclease VII large subunit [Clostridia bacterium]
MEEKNIFTITQLNSYIKNIIESDFALKNIWLKGEISIFKAHTSGHLYLTLKDENSVINAVMFKGSASGLLFRPENGMKVTVKCSIRVYEPMGGYQAYITEMEKDGLGDLHLAFEELKKKLAAEGLFDAARKKPIPHFPERIGIVTSPTGAAIRDMLNIIGRRCNYAKVYIYPALVQGEDAPPQIIEGIEYFNKTKSVDVIITGRGGGSIEDLWAFNDEGVARCIAASTLPVISAVGHEIDFTIADFVADLRAATPSEAAERVATDSAELKKRLETAAEKLAAGLTNNITQKKLQLEALSLDRIFDGFKTGLEDKKIKIDEYMENISKSMNILLERKQQQLKMQAAGLEALSPLAVLSRGYSIAFGKEGKPLVKTADVEKGDTVTVKLSDGEFGARVENIRKAEK